jgi:predicted branched-subunit amino acid permease
LIARRPFVAWVVVGVVMGFALTPTPLFLIALPLTIVAIIVVRRRAREPDDMLGVACGVGLVLLLSSSAALRLAGAAALVAGIGLHALIGRLGRRPR